MNFKKYLPYAVVIGSPVIIGFIGGMLLLFTPLQITALMSSLVLLSLFLNDYFEWTGFRLTGMPILILIIWGILICLIWVSFFKTPTGGITGTPSFDSFRFPRIISVMIVSIPAVPVLVQSLVRIVSRD